MSDQFFSEMGVRQPDFDLGVGPGPHAAQTAEIMRRIESVMMDVRPDRVLVVGDENSTLAAALTAVKLRMPVAHVDAGLRNHRSNDAGGDQPRPHRCDLDRSLCHRAEREWRTSAEKVGPPSMSTLSVTS